MKVKSLGLLLLLAGCGESVKVEWKEPEVYSCDDSSHDSYDSVEVAGDATSSVDVPQSVSDSTDATQAKD
jgi:hypothetical protein